MASVVGTKGQIVISKAIRDQLGVEAGWLAVQTVVGDHVEIHFVPPEHRRSLKGSLAGHVKRKVAPGRAWDAARRRAWEKAAGEKGRNPAGR